MRVAICGIQAFFLKGGQVMTVLGRGGDKSRPRAFIFDLDQARPLEPNDLLENPDDDGNKLYTDIVDLLKTRKRSQS